MKIFSILLAILLTSDYLAAEQVVKVPKATKEFSANNAKTQAEFYGDPDDAKTVASSLSTKKTSCIQQSVYPDKTLDQQKKILIEKAKQESLEELYGALIFSSTDIENGKLKKDEIKSRAVGAVRVKGNPEFYNGKNLGEICSDVISYITPEDLEKYSPKKVSLKHFCFNDSSVAMKDIKDQARLAAYKEMIIQYKPSMKSISKEQAENLLHGFKESDSKFDFETASYCFDAVGTILPYELEFSQSKISVEESKETLKPFIGKSCSEIKQHNKNSKNGMYQIQPNSKILNVYCEMETDGGGWTQFAYIDDPSNNFDGSKHIGTFDNGECDNDSVCSLKIDKLYKNDIDTFDLMIKYGDKKEYSLVLNSFEKDNGSYFVKPNYRVSQVGEHGTIGTNSVNNFFASYCTAAGLCGSTGADYFNFTSDGCYPSDESKVSCGFYGFGGAHWKSCKKSDNKYIMKYFIRENIEMSDGKNGYDNKKEKQQKAFNGIWEGYATQSSNGSSWNLKVTLKNDIYRIDYPSLNCGGDLILISKDEKVIKFHEKLKYGKANCVDDGIVVLALTDSNDDTKLIYDWYYSNGKKEVNTIIIKQ